MLLGNVTVFKTFLLNLVPSVELFSRLLYSVQSYTVQADPGSQNQSVEMLFYQNAEMTPPPPVWLDPQSGAP